MKNSVTKAIISCAWFYDQVDPSNPLFAKVYEPPQEIDTNTLIGWLSMQITKEMERVGVLIVTTTGHRGLTKHADEYLPPTADARFYPRTIIPVGATNRLDEKMFDDGPASRYVQIRAWAPGEGVHALGYTFSGNPGSVPVSGVSFGKLLNTSYSLEAFKCP
ncbi:hypothetical protein TWF730_011047 [Orbilia blumenaviensis]|uniref:Uncharacterized protein n=1 Tax=Orbilia blumenaviensis TaxID=1796055 RepID=A0AAV9UNQ5_9PEZI